MVKHVFAVSLDKEVIDKVKKILKKWGGSVSAIVNQLLIEWLIKNDPDYKIKKEEASSKK